MPSAAGTPLTVADAPPAFTATEVPVADRGPVIAAYRKKWDWEVKRYFDALPDVADHPVFRIQPAA